MLATLFEQPFHRPGWVYEEKYDGYRILAYKEGDRVTLRSRNDKDRTQSFAEIARAVAGLSERTLLLDGEAVAFDQQGVSRFQLLQQSAGPIVLAAFDCLYRNGRDLRAQPLTARRAVLEQVMAGTNQLLLSRRLAQNGLEAFALARQRGFEGLVAKNGASRYREGRSTEWLKVKVRQEEELVVGGYTPPTGSRAYFGALLLGAYSGRELRYVGKVGTGFTAQTLAELYQRFRSLERARSPFAKPPREPGAVFLAPQLVAQISFQEWTADGRLRQPVFLGLRDDKRPQEVQLPARFRRPA